jgi:DNA-binding XRE family transcriptional regulator
MHGDLRRVPPAQEGRMIIGKKPSLTLEQWRFVRAIAARRANGEAVPTMTALARSLNVSRTTIRNAELGECSKHHFAAEQAASVPRGTTNNPENTTCSV